MKNYRWGIIGPGKIARKFAAALNIAGNATLEAIASRHVERAREFASTFHVPRYHDSYEALASDPDIDAIYIATPHAFHHSQALLCLAHGKAVLCEKPMALSERQVSEMAAASQKHNVFLMEAMWTRFLPHTNRMLDLIKEGRLGSVRYVRADFGFPGAYYPDSRLYNLDLGGGALLDIGVYPLFLVLLLLGKPSKIHAVGQLAGTGADQTTHALMEFSDGATAAINATFACQTSITAEICGTEGMIQIPSAWYKTDRFSFRKPGADAIPEDFQLEPTVNGFEYQIRELQRCVEEGLVESPMMPHSFSKLLAGTMDEIRRQTGVRYPGQ